MSKVNRNDFVARNSGKAVKLDKIADAKTRADLAKLDANKDGKLSGQGELDAAFRYADGFDHDGSSQSLIDVDAKGKRTAAGNVIAALEGAAVSNAPNGADIANAALDRIAKFGANYGVDGTWKSPNPNIPGNAKPDQTPFSALKGHWKCNLFALDSVYQAGFQTPSYAANGKGWYPVAVDLHNFSKGPNRFFDNLAEVKLNALTPEQKQAEIAKVLAQAKPGDLIIVNHQGPDAADGGHCRVVVANNFAKDGTVACAQASYNSAVVKNEPIGSFANDEIIYLLRPCKPRPGATTQNPPNIA